MSFPFWADSPSDTAKIETQSQPQVISAGENSDMGTFLDSIGGNIIDLANTATAFGQGAIASDISGNPIFSQDPAAASYSVGGVRTGVATGSILPMIAIAVVAYMLIKK